ncbi:hypothetical protein C7I87_28235 [Mesorhizobium sp. SARCC-RB16n]|nr:hypothetical protein C7I87_28235 [Mesorhizobium sp. SARCC-RB16n]
MAEPAVNREPAVSIRKSVTPDLHICLEDGKKFKSLVAPNYAAARSALAKAIGLGRKPMAPEGAKVEKPKRMPRAAAVTVTAAAAKSSVKKTRKDAAKA